jgi:clan AA aspartic protease (TIGR02281 family)
MLQLISMLKKENSFHSIAESLDNAVLVEAGSIKLLIEAVYAYSKAYSFKTALDLLESSDDEIVKSVDDKNRLKNLHVDLYKAVLSELIRKNDYSYGSSIFKKAIKVFPEDSEIHLLGVETELVVGKWKEAKRLLLMREYPGELSAKASMLKYQILELEREDGKLVIRFTPGSKHIPTIAKLSPKVRQRFIVDTGATKVSIPTSTAEKLGLEKVPDTRKILVSTAGGITSAWETIIPTIEINNYKVKNVKALVLDIPSNPTLGLLGQNYLERFQVEIDNEKGLLLLKPL